MHLYESDTSVQYFLTRTAPTQQKGVNAPIVTEGATFEALQDNIRDAVALHFEGDDPESLGFERSPAILTNFEIA